jgi:tRNA-splicing ligase RtcB
MNDVMSLAPVIAGALMPDAHVGYGMPIGGVAAVEKAVIPYAVGVDIGCRMHLTIFREPTADLGRLRTKLREAILKGTHFGRALRPKALEHPLLDDPRLAAVERRLQKKDLRTRAALQFGTSGGGNHFVEFGEIRLQEPAEGIPAGNWLALLSHSGSRALGYNIANHFSALAQELTRLPKELERLAWLSMDTEEGQAYWDAMELAGEYSAVNHQVIHDTVTALSGLTPVRAVSNHHNFAWRETHGGEEFWVVRKGATPAFPGQLGFVGGSMGDDSVILEGVDSPESREALYSTVHGAGRVMSRTAAKGKRGEAGRVTKEMMSKWVKDRGVVVRGGDVDEAPPVYKRLHRVLEHHSETIRIRHTLRPLGVAMAGADVKDPFKD